MRSLILFFLLLTATPSVASACGSMSPHPSQETIAHALLYTVEEAGIGFRCYHTRHELPNAGKDLILGLNSGHEMSVAAKQRLSQLTDELADANGERLLYIRTNDEVSHKDTVDIIAWAGFVVKTTFVLDEQGTLLRLEIISGDDTCTNFVHDSPNPNILGVDDGLGSCELRYDVLKSSTS